ncbi:MAG TPA: hypothetical protein VJV79_34325 [Polyangiaceae bacterium]|nr:hypothetical protein [Polyangiaceae bacterium]
MLASFRTFSFSVFLVLLGCSGRDRSGSANRAGTGGGDSLGNSGSAGGGDGSAGRAGGAALGGGAPNAGLSGNGGAGAGTTPSGGGTAGTLAAAGAGMVGVSLTGGASNQAGNGAGGNTSDRGPAPTFTLLYDTIITPSCGGARCHLKRPTPFGYDFSSKSAASAAWRSDVYPGDAEGSPMFQVLNFGIMPKDQPPLSIEQLFMVYDWINAGALDN